MWYTYIHTFIPQSFRATSMNQAPCYGYMIQKDRHHFCSHRAYSLNGKTHNETTNHDKMQYASEQKFMVFWGSIAGEILAEENDLPEAIKVTHFLEISQVRRHESIFPAEKIIYVKVS